MKVYVFQDKRPGRSARAGVLFPYPEGKDDAETAFHAAPWPASISVNHGNSKPRFLVQVAIPAEVSCFSWLGERVEVGCTGRTALAPPVDPTIRPAQKFRSDYDDHGPTAAVQKRKNEGRKKRSKAERKAAVMRHNGSCTILQYQGRLRPGGEVKIATDSDETLIGKAGVMKMAREGSGGDMPDVMFVECISLEAQKIIEEDLGIPVVRVWFEQLEDELLRDMGYAA